MFKKVFLILFSFIFSISLIIIAYANEIDNIPELITEITTNNYDDDNIYNVPNPQEAAGIPDVSADAVIERINTKGNDVVNILQSLGKWICIGSFIIYSMMIIFGIIGNKKLALSSFIGIFIACIAYAGITFGREIVIFISTWVAS